MEVRPPEPESAATRPAAALAAWVFGWCTISAATAMVLFTSSGHDDSYITYAAAYALRATGSITNFNGERLEQSSTLATTVLLALGDAALPFLSLPALGFLLSMGAAALCTALATRLAEHLSPGSGWAAAPLAATTTPLVYWAASGMETTLAAASQVAFVLAAAGFVTSPSVRRGAGVVAAATLLATVRPEGPIVLTCALTTLVAWAAVRRRSDESRAVAGVVAASAAVIAVLVAWRLQVFGLWLPHPATVKASGVARSAEGLRYLKYHLQWAPALAVGGLIGAEPQLEEARDARTPHGVLAAGVVVADAAFVVFSGGDWMEFGRFLAPGLGVAAALLAAVVGGRPWTAHTKAAIIALLVVARLGLDLNATRRATSGRPLWDAFAVRDQLERALPGTHVDLLDAGNQGHARDVLMLAVLDPLIEQLRARTNEPIVLFSGQAGMIPYTLFQRHESLVFIDACSLTTNRVNPYLDPTNLKATTFGVRFPLTALIEAAPVIRAATGLELPHVIWESGQERPPEDAGYVLIYDHPSLRRPDGWFGNQTIADGYIAVRGDWAQVLGLRAVEQTPLVLE